MPKLYKRYNMPVFHQSMAFVNIIERLSGGHKEDKSEKSPSSVEKLLASHPDTVIRLIAFRDAEIKCNR